MKIKEGYALVHSRYISAASSKFSQFLREASTVVPAEEFFDMNEFMDTSNQQKLTVYITPDELVQVHNSLVENLENLPNSSEDPLRIILNELGAPPAPGTAAKGPGSEIVLHLSNRFAAMQGNNDQPVKKLMKEAKRMILIVIRYSAGPSLLDILEDPTTEAQEQKFAAYCKERESGNVTDSNLSLDALQEQSSSPETSPKSATASPLGLDSSMYQILTSTTFAQLKIRALEAMAKLETMEKVSKADKYQSMLDSIVEDMLNKQKSRANRRREIQQLTKTAANLEEKSKFLDESTKSYHDYIEACMAQLTNKKG